MPVQFDGLDELIQQLTDAPQHIRDEGMVIVREETEGAAAEIVAALPRKTGTLAKRVKTSYPSSTLLVGLVQSTAPHAHLYEFGTKQRSTKAGANRGISGPHKTTPQIAQKRRERMYRRLREMVTRMGFQVSGD